MTSVWSRSADHTLAEARPEGSSRPNRLGDAARYLAHNARVDPYAGIGMHWGRMVWAALLPAAVAFPAARFAWRRHRVLLGNITGTAVLLGAAITFAALEFGDAYNYRLLCEATGTACRASDPSDFTKIAAYGLIAFVQIGVLFLASLRSEEQTRRSEVAAEWRRLKN